MKKIAITGGIASGKSEVCKVIEQLGEYVIYTDKINNELLSDSDYVKQLANIFPDAVKNGVVDRKKIRCEIASCEDKRQSLNSLAHSEIRKRVENLINNFNGEAIFCEIPLIVESGMQQDFDYIWCVIADYDTRIARLMARDNVTELDAKKIIDCQLQDDQLIAIADNVIKNNGDLEKLKEDIKELLCTTIK